MTYIAEDVTKYKCRTEYWKTLYPMRENERLGNYSRRIKMKLYSEYYEKINKNSREYMKHKYHTDEKYKEYQKQNVLRRYYKDREKDKLFFEPLTNLNKGI